MRHRPHLHLRLRLRPPTESGRKGDGTLRASGKWTHRLLRGTGRDSYFTAMILDDGLASTLRPTLGTGGETTTNTVG